MPLPRLPFSFPPRGIALLAFCALYLLPGLIGHDPWKNEDAMHFGVALSMLDGGSWLAPQLAGDQWVSSPPLYYWVAAVFAKVFGLLLPTHDAARLATGFFVGIMIVFLGGAARLLIGNEAGRGAVLISIGTLGLLVHSHESQPVTVLLAATAAVYFGLARLPRHPIQGGMIAGTALGVGFLALGLPAVLALAPMLALLPLISSHLRTPQAAKGLLAALAVGAPLMMSWPLALYWQDPAFLSRWWMQEMADLRLHANWPTALWEYLKILSWFAWPALPLAMWTLWKERKRLLEPRILVPLGSFIVMLGVQTTFFELRSLNALPLLPPLILLASPATTSLRRGAANAFDWFGMMTFTLLGSLIWLGWLAMVAGVPARIARNFARLEPGFVGQFSVLAFLFAMALTLAWLWLIFASPRSPQRGATHWAAGIILCWGLLAALWTPWIDHGRSYRAVFVNLKSALPAVDTCVGGRGLGNTQRAALHYFAGITLQREGGRMASHCRLYLIQGTAQNESLPPGSGWRKIWEDRRPSDRNERFRLYVRE